MLNLFKKKKSDEGFFCPVTGTCIPLDDVEDEMFSQRMLGDGFAIEPQDGTIYSPINGIVSVVYPSKHAIGIKGKDYEVLIHIGIDTVDLNGEGFTSYIQQGDIIKAKDRLVHVDLNLLKKNERLSTCMFIFTSGEKILLNFQQRNYKAKECMNSINIMK